MMYISNLDNDFVLNQWLRGKKLIFFTYDVISIAIVNLHFKEEKKKPDHWHLNKWVSISVSQVS